MTRTGIAGMALRALGRRTALALFVAGMVLPAAYADPRFGTQGWIDQKIQNPLTAVPTESPSANAPYAGIGTTTTPDQARVRAHASMRNLAEAARRIAEAQAAQQAAAQAVSAGSFVPDGLTEGGLQIAPGAEISGSPLWLNAELPQQTVAPERTTVTVEQTAENALLTWQSFNIGPNTTLHFDQSAGTDADGNNDWIALNRVANAIAPSLIYGRLEAEGSVYLINNNGILFGGGSQVNTHSLLATTLGLFDVDPVKSAEAYLHQGLLGLPDGTPALPYPFAKEFAPDPADAILGPPPPLPGDVVVEAGATIRTGELGYTMLAGTHVSNAGTIITNDGQAILAAALGLEIERLAETGPGASLLGLQSLYWLKYERPTGESEGVLERPDVTPVMTVTNTGVIRAERGNVTLMGSRVLQNGIIEVSSSLTRPGTISLIGIDGTILLPRASIDPQCVKTVCVPPVQINYGFFERVDLRTVILGEGSTTAVLPSLNGERTLSTERADANFDRGGITIEADAITLAPGALVVAPGASFSATTRPPARTVDTSLVNGRIYIDRGAIVDVSGLADVRLSADSTLLTIPRIGLNELANSPVQRDGFLFRQTDVVIDSTVRGIRDDGTPWVGSPLLNVEGYVEGVERAIPQLLTDGGSITLTASQIVTAPGSSLRLDGGYLHHEGSHAAASETRLLGTDGRYYALSQADPLATYVGLAGVQTVAHSRWNQTSVYANPLITGARTTASAYITGGDAGTLTLNIVPKIVNLALDSTGQAPQLVPDHALLLAGEFSARALAGRRQIESARLPDGGTLLLRGAGSAAVPFIVTIGDTAPELGSGFGPGSPVAQAHTTEVALVGPMLTDAGLSHVSIFASGIGVEGAHGLAVQPGGSITLRSAGNGPALADPAIDIAADLSAPGGRIDITSLFALQYVPDVTVTGQLVSILPAPVAPDINISATLSVRGRWVNDAGVAADARGGSAYIDGGSISLAIDTSFCCNDSTNVVVDPFSFAVGDLSGSIVLAPGGVLDVSSGGYLGPDGTLATRHGRPLGRGGDIALTTYGTSQGCRPTTPSQACTPAGVATPLTPQNPGSIVLDGMILAYGFGGGGEPGERTGGTLSLRTLDIQVGGTGAAAKEATHLQPAFFATQGFAAYDFSAAWDFDVADGVNLQLTHLNLLPTADIVLAPTGADLYDTRYARIGSLDDYRRGPTDLTVVAGDAVLLGAPPRGQNVEGGVRIGRGAGIFADPGSSIALSGALRTTVLGTIVAPGGAIALTQTGLTMTRALLGTNTGLPNPFPIHASVWLGGESILDVSGMTLLDPTTTPIRVGDATVVPRIGRVLDGGSVTLGNASYVVAQGGATIDISGAYDRLDLIADGAPPRLQELVASDAGSLTLAASGGLFFNADVAAQGGGARSRGGSLSVRSTAGGTLLGLGLGGVVLQMAQPSIDGALPGEQLGGTYVGQTNPHPTAQGATVTIHTATLPGILNFSVAELADWGIDNFRVSTGLLAFRGNVDLALAGRFDASATTYAALAGSVIPNSPSAVTISAPYISFGGQAGSAPLIGTAGAPATLTLNASDGLDIFGQTSLRNFTAASFNSGGDLRFVMPDSLGQAPGLLYGPGSLAFSAERIYPASGTTFAIAAPTSVQFDRCSLGPVCQGTAGVTPLSAGGALRVASASIVQNGVLSTPLGDIVLGVASPTDTATRLLFGATLNGAGAPVGGLPLVATQNVAFGPGSRTSVSAGGGLIPYGTFLDSTDWQYRGVTLEAPPTGEVLVTAANIALDSAAELDLGAGQVVSALSYRREGTAVTVTQPAHGLRVGDLVYVKDAAELNDAYVRVIAVSDGAWSFEAPVVPVDLGAQDGFAYERFGTSVTVDHGNHSFRAGDLVLVQNAGGGLDGLRRIVAVDDASWTFEMADVGAGSGALTQVRTSDLQATEWIAGLGGTRDVLARYNTVFVNNQPEKVELFPDERPVYAILPGYQGLAPYDPEFDADGDGLSLVGQSVFLSGVGDLRPDTYTLLPARYATLPGAYRLVQDTSALDTAPQHNAVLADGSYRVSGYFADGFSVEDDVPVRHDSRATAFLVQSQSAWGQYSDYLLASGNGHFATRAAQAGVAPPVLPRDGGLLSLGASATMTLGAQLITTPGQFGAAAAVDLASGRIQIIGGAAEGLPGYLQIPVADLAQLGAGSVLIGGTRARTGSADQLTAVATSVVLSNDTASVLAAPEILLLASGSVELEEDAALKAEGELTASRSAPIVIGRSDVAGSGNGALVRVSTAAPVTVTRLAASNQGLLTLGARSTIDGGESLVLDAAGNVQAPPTALFYANHTTLAADSIRFVASADAVGSGVLLGPQTLARLRDAATLTLASDSSIVIDRGLQVALGESLWLSAGSILAGEGSGDVGLAADRVVLDNRYGGTGNAAPAAAGLLRIETSEMEFGSGALAIGGFADIEIDASSRVVARGNGSGAIDFGAADVWLATPLVAAGRGSDTTLRTAGTLAATSTGTAGVYDEIGGTLRLVAGDLDLATKLAAPAGVLDVLATSGDVHVAAQGALDASGVALTFFDIQRYAPGGAIRLQSATGNVEVDAGASLNFAGATDAKDATAGGDAGQLVLAAPEGTVLLLGTLSGKPGAPGARGGRIALDTGGAFDLNNLAIPDAAAGGGGLYDRIHVRTRTGDLVLGAGQQLVANRVVLIADAHGLDAGRPVPASAGGHVVIAGTIDASGADGGRIELSGFGGVEVQGELRARATDATDGRGGDVMLATSGSGDGTYHGTRGYQNVTAERSGTITLGPDARIDVGSASADPAHGGTIALRLPLLGDVGSGSVNFTSAAEFAGYRDLELEAYAVWSTADTDSPQRFTGIIDPVGNPNFFGQIAYTGMDPTCQSRSPGCGYFTDTGRLGANVTPSGTLMMYVRDFMLAGVPAIAGLRLRPGIELRAEGQGAAGAITVASNWNLAAAGLDCSPCASSSALPDGTPGGYLYPQSQGTFLPPVPLGTGSFNGYGVVREYAYRTDQGQAPVLTLRASTDVNVSASLSDGFVQLAAPGATVQKITQCGVGSTSGTCVTPLDPQAVALQAAQAYDYAHARALYDTLAQHFPNLEPYIAQPVVVGESSALVAQYYGLYTQYMEYLLYGKLPAARWFVSNAPIYSIAAALDAGARQNPALLSTGSDPRVPVDPRAYAAYLYNYDAARRCGPACAYPLQVPQAPSSAYLTNPAIGVTEIFTGAALARVDNGVSPVSSDLIVGALMGGPGTNCSGASCTSTSMRILAGSDLRSAYPTAVVPYTDALVSAGLGSIRFTQTAVGQVNRSGNTVTSSVALAPNVLRTGSGKLDLAAARDFVELGGRASAIYTAGVAAPGLRANTDLIEAAALPLAASSCPANGCIPILANGSAHPVAAGDVRLSVQGDVLGLAQPASSQAWWQWMQTGNVVERAIGGIRVAVQLASADGAEFFATLSGAEDATGLRAGMVKRATETSINFANFAQGLLSAGGDIEVAAGGTIQNLHASLPTTWYLDSGSAAGWTVVGGGGTLDVEAGQDIISGSYFVSRGTGRIAADGRIGGSPAVRGGLAALLAVQDAQLDVLARQSVDIAGIYNPSYILPRTVHAHPLTLAPNFISHWLYYISRDGQPYSAQSSATIVAASGALAFGTLPYDAQDRAFLDGWAGRSSSLETFYYLQMPAEILPASLELAALAGDLSIVKGGQMYPSSERHLNLIAAGGINFLNRVVPLRWTKYLPAVPGALGFSEYSAAVNGNDQGNNPALLIDAMERGTRYFGMINAPVDLLPSPVLQHNGASIGVEPSLALQDRFIGVDSMLQSPTPWSADYGASRVYALGDITNGSMPEGYRTNHGLNLSLNMPVHFRAGRDIVNLVFDLNHGAASDVSVISAGRDVRHDRMTFSQSAPIKVGRMSNGTGVPFVVFKDPQYLPHADWKLVPRFTISGPGTLVIQAGRDVGPFIGPQDVATARMAPQTVAYRTFGVVPYAFFDVLMGDLPLTGINSVGNLANPYLPERGADIVTLFGVGPGVAHGQFAQRYLEPPAGAAGVRSFLPELVSFVKRYSAAPELVDASNAWALFLALPETVQQLLSYEVFFQILQLTATDYNNPRSDHYRRYVRGYEAIQTLFPAELGYTRNALRGGFNGAAETSLVHTGDFHLRGSTLQTQDGGDISVFGPGGNAIIGSTAAANLVYDAKGDVFAGLSTQGVLTLAEGDIRFFVDRSMLLGQSRMFTEQGGDIVIWSSNGDISAGRGARSASEVPRPVYECDDEHYCEEDRAGRVTGAGIATLQSIPGAPPGDVYLVAPRGTVDAGEGGIRVSGNLVVAAFAVANADNIQVQGITLGVPSSKVDVGALNAGSSAVAAAQQQAAALARQAPPPGRAETLITVEVVGFGEPRRRRR